MSLRGRAVSRAGKRSCCVEGSLWESAPALVWLHVNGRERSNQDSITLALSRPKIYSLKRFLHIQNSSSIERTFFFFFLLVA